MIKKIALITGASRGLGAALSERLSETHHIIAVARTVGGLEDLDDRIKSKNGTATLAPMDITNRDAMSQLFTSIFEKWGTIDFWAHTAIHAPPLSPLNTIDLGDLDKTISTNITATALLINFISPIMSKEGRALFFDDPCNGKKFFGAYGSSKIAQMSLVQSWANECKNFGPNVTVFTPAPMKTALRARFFPGENKENLLSPKSEAKRVLATLFDP